MIPDFRGPDVVRLGLPRADHPLRRRVGRAGPAARRSWPRAGTALRGRRPPRDGPTWPCAVSPRCRSSRSSPSSWPAAEARPRRTATAPAAAPQAAVGRRDAAAAYAASPPARDPPRPRADPHVPRRRRPAARRGVPRAVRRPRPLRGPDAGAARAGWTAVTLDDAYRSWHGGPGLPRKPVVVSFDDGYSGQSTAAARTPARPRLAGRAGPRGPQPPRGGRPAPRCRSGACSRRAGSSPPTR